MTTENIRLVSIDQASASRRLIFQFDSGVPAATRPTFALDVPYWQPVLNVLGQAIPSTNTPSRVEDVGGGAGAGLVTTYTFKPGGVADPTNRVYITWAALLVAHNADTGQRAILFDNTLAAITITTGAVNFGGRTQLAPAAATSGSVPVTFAAGASFTGALSVSPLLAFGA